MGQATETKLYKREGAYIPRVAAVHDLCGYGKCSLGVAIPALSAGLRRMPRSYGIVFEPYGISGLVHA